MADRDVPDLMAALEASLAKAKAQRDEAKRNDPFLVADREIRAWVYKAERVMNGDELGEFEWDTVHHFLSNAADWADYARRRQQGYAPKNPERS